MKIVYTFRQTGGRLLAYDATKEEATALTNRLWNFILSHRHHVLRTHYAECKIANAYQPQFDFEQTDGSFAVLNFFSPFNSHKEYLTILRRELGLEIEEIPQAAR